VYSLLIYKYLKRLGFFAIINFFLDRQKMLGNECFSFFIENARNSQLKEAKSLDLSLLRRNAL